MKFFSTKRCVNARQEETLHKKAGQKSFIMKMILIKKYTLIKQTGF